MVLREKHSEAMMTIAQQEAITIVKQEASPSQATVEHSCPEGLLTPPASNRKSIGCSKSEPDTNEVLTHTITKTTY